MVSRLFARIAAVVLCVASPGCDTTEPESEVPCPGSMVGNTSLPPEINIVDLEAGDDTIRGTANNICASTTHVVLWAKTDIWYVQPLEADPLTIISSDGSWENGTHSWDRMVALLVDTAVYEPGSTRLYHPSSDPGVLAWDEYPDPAPDRTIEFSGYTWVVKAFEDDPFDPGPNYWSDSESDVWVDSAGLHLTTVYRDGKWYSTEVFADEPLGYGEYTFQVTTRVDSLDDRVVFAGFVYDTVNQEFDIEFSRTLASPNNAQYVVQPFDSAGNRVTFLMPAADLSTHRFEWRADRIEFTSWRGLDTDPHPDSIIQTWTYTGSDIPSPGTERMRFNLWLVGGSPPMSGQPDQIAIKAFSYLP